MHDNQNVIFLYIQYFINHTGFYLKVKNLIFPFPRNRTVELILVGTLTFDEVRFNEEIEDLFYSDYLGFEISLKIVARAKGSNY